MLDAFGINIPLADDYIEANTSAIWESGDLEVLIPSYIAWCLRTIPEKQGLLVSDAIIEALAELGRAKPDASQSHMRYKYALDPKQVQIICEFLHWSKQNMLVHDKYVDRALKHWQK